MAAAVSDFPPDRPERRVREPSLNRSKRDGMPFIWSVWWKSRGAKWLLTWWFRNRGTHCSPSASWTAARIPKKEIVIDPINLRGELAMLAFS